MLAGIIASPSAYSPRANPIDAEARRNQVLTNMEDQGYITPTELAGVLAGADPHRRRHPAAAGGLGGPVLHLLAAPAAGRQVRRRPGLRRRTEGDLDAGPGAAAPGGGDRLRPPRRDRADRLGGGARQRDRPGAGDGRWQRLRQGALQPGDQRASPARIVVQALHPGDRAGPGPLARGGLHLGAAGDPLPGGGTAEGRQLQEAPAGHIRGQQLRRQLPGLRLDGDGDDLLRQLRLLPDRDPGRTGERRRHREEDGDRDRPLDR